MSLLMLGRGTMLGTPHLPQRIWKNSRLEKLRQYRPCKGGNERESSAQDFVVDLVLAEQGLTEQNKECVDDAINVGIRRSEPPHIIRASQVWTSTSPVKSLGLLTLGGSGLKAII